MKVLKYRSTRSRFTATLRKAQKSKIYQLYISTAMTKLLKTDYVEIEVCDNASFILKPTKKPLFKLSPHGNGGAVISASSMVATKPELAKFKRFEFIRLTVSGGFLFSAKSEKGDED